MMLHQKYRKMAEPNRGHTYSVHEHGKSGKIHQWLLCRDSDVFDRHLVEEKDLGDPRQWLWLE